MAEWESIPVLEDVYLALLRHPFDDWRVRNQSVYARVLDRLADLHGRDPETTQNYFEAKANAADTSETR